MIEVFLYGLFMDSELLKKKGVSPNNPRLAAVNGYALEIGERATIVRAGDSEVYGFVMSLSRPDLDKLYAEPSVSDYRPITITVTVANGTKIDAACYVLPESDRSRTPNREYAFELLHLAQRLGLPSEYLAEIQRFGDP